VISPFSVWIGAVSDETVTVVSAEPTFSWAFTVVDWPTVTTMPCRHELNPFAVTVTA